MLHSTIIIVHSSFFGSIFISFYDKQNIKTNNILRKRIPHQKKHFTFQKSFVCYRRFPIVKTFKFPEHQVCYNYIGLHIISWNDTFCFLTHHLIWTYIHEEEVTRMLHIKFIKCIGFEFYYIQLYFIFTSQNIMFASGNTMYSINVFVFVR